MRIPAYLACLLVLAVLFFFLRRFVNVVRFSARLLMGLIVLAIVVAASLLSGHRQGSTGMQQPTYQTRQPTDPLR